MNAAVHTSTRVHRCRDDVLGISAICLTTPGGHDDALDALARWSSRTATRLSLRRMASAILPPAPL